MPHVQRDLLIEQPDLELEGCPVWYRGLQEELAEDRGCPGKETLGLTNDYKRLF